MCWFVPLIIMGGAALAGGLQQSQANEDATKAAVDAANYNAREYDRQASILDSQAVDAYERGEQDRLRYMREFEQEQGGRAASFGASGVDVNSGSALDILADSAASAALDAATIRNNAAREAWDYREQARTAKNNAYLTRKGGADAITAGKHKQQSIILNTVGSMAGSMSGFAGGGASAAGATAGAGMLQTKEIGTYRNTI